jgi:hypothetical protein
MSVKCPSCGFDAAEDALYCDFCKHPFRREKAAPPAPEKPAADPAAALAGLSKEALEKIPAHLLPLTPDPPLKAPPWLKHAAWVFLFACLAAMVAVSFVANMRYRERPPQPEAPLAVPKRVWKD